MTAEERMAYFQGEKRRSPAVRPETAEKNKEFLVLKIKFTIAVLLFITFLSLDYTGYEIRGIGSGAIIEKVTTDFEIPEDFLSKISL